MKPEVRVKLLITKPFPFWLVLAFAAPMPVPAQDVPAVSTEESVDSALAAMDAPVTEPDADEVVDEITVFGTRSLQTMQRQIERADYDV